METKKFTLSYVTSKISTLKNRPAQMEIGLDRVKVILNASKDVEQEILFDVTLNSVEGQNYNHTNLDWNVTTLPLYIEGKEYVFTNFSPKTGEEINALLEKGGAKISRKKTTKKKNNFLFYLYLALFIIVVGIVIFFHFVKKH
jgi:ATP-dependent Zn protease